KIGGAVLCRRMRTPSLGKGELFRTRSPHQSRQTVVSFDAAGLVIKSVLLIALPAELLADSPGLGPHRRFFDRGNVLERGRPGARPPLDQMQVLPRALKVRLRAEVRHVDDERIPFPVTTGVTVPLADIGRQVRTSVHNDVALPPLP